MKEQKIHPRRREMKVILLLLLILVFPREGSLAENQGDETSFFGGQLIIGGADSLRLWALGLYGQLDRIGMRYLLERDNSTLEIKNDKIFHHYYSYTANGMTSISLDLFYLFAPFKLQAFLGGGIGFSHHENPSFFGGTFYSLRCTYGLGYTLKGIRVTIEKTHIIPVNLITEYEGLFQGLRVSLGFGTR